MSQPKVSIIIPVYNVEKHVSDCIESVLKQSFKDFELILVDDGSPDNSGKICDVFAEKDHRIRVLHKKNGGVSSARNLGIDNASGEWICFVDSDDWVDQDYCLNLISAVESQSSLIMTRNDFPGKKIDSIKECRDLSGEERIDFIILNRILDFSGPCCKLFNRDIIYKNNIRFPENIHMGEDGIFMAQYLNATDSLTVLNLSDYHYMDNLQSLSHRYYDFRSEWDCFTLWKAELSKLFTSKKLIDNIEFNKLLWNNRIGDTFFRCILCLSRQKNKLTSKQILYYINSIPKNLWEEFDQYYTPSSMHRRIAKFILKLHLQFLNLFLFKLDRLMNS